MVGVRLSRVLAVGGAVMVAFAGTVTSAFADPNPMFTVSVSGVAPEETVDVVLTTFDQSATSFQAIDTRSGYTISCPPRTRTMGRSYSIRTGRVDGSLGQRYGPALLLGDGLPVCSDSEGNTAVKVTAGGLVFLTSANSRYADGELQYQGFYFVVDKCNVSSRPEPIPIKFENASSTFTQRGTHSGPRVSFADYCGHTGLLGSQIAIGDTFRLVFRVKMATKSTRSPVSITNA